MKLFALLTLMVANIALASPAPDLHLRQNVDDKAPKIDDPKFISTCMDAHWYWRRIHCAQDFTWDPKLAQQALRDASTCDKDAKHITGGSNLSSVSMAPGDYNAWITMARAVIHGWHEEEPKYPYDNPHYEGAWGHFTQLVWRDSSRVGCALVNCINGANFPARMYCVYERAGNNIADGEFKKNVWAPICADPKKGSKPRHVSTI